MIGTDEGTAMADSNQDDKRDDSPEEVTCTGSVKIRMPGTEVRRG
jgi:hypothetical protein